MIPSVAFKPWVDLHWTVCALFLPQWSELKTDEKPVQSLLPAGLRLVPTAWACRRSPSPRTRAVSLFQTLLQTLKEEHPAVEDKTAKPPWRLTASTRVLSSARRMEGGGVWGVAIDRRR